MMPPLPPRTPTCLRTCSLGRVIFFLPDLCLLTFVVLLLVDMRKPNFARTCHDLESDVLLSFNHFSAEAKKTWGLAWVLLGCLDLGKFDGQNGQLRPWQFWSLTSPRPPAPPAMPSWAQSGCKLLQHCGILRFFSVLCGGMNKSHQIALDIVTSIVQSILGRMQWRHLATEWWKCMLGVEWMDTGHRRVESYVAYELISLANPFLLRRNDEMLRYAGLHRGLKNRQLFFWSMLLVVRLVE